MGCWCTQIVKRGFTITINHNLNVVIKLPQYIIQPPRPIVFAVLMTLFCLSFVQPCFLFHAFDFPLSCFSFSCSICLFPILSHTHLLLFFWFYPVSFLWPHGDLFPVLGNCVLWLRQQMLPITVRNMPSISPLILKRLKVQFSLPLLAHSLVSTLWMLTTIICEQYLSKPPTTYAVFNQLVAFTAYEYFKMFFFFR